MRIKILLCLVVASITYGANLNTASKNELMELGLSKGQALNIIKYRKAHKFKSIDELEKVQGIGFNDMQKVKEKLSIKEMISFIASCDLVIGNDSGLTHLAWAMNRPSITLFGNRPSHRNAYITDKNLVIDMGKQIDARSIDKNDFCIREIFPETVANFAKRLLNG